MLPKRLKYRFANRAYASRRWPHSRSLLPVQTSSELSQISLQQCCQIAGLSSPRQLRRLTGISYQAITLLSDRQTKRMRCNAYHNKAHVAQVILAAGVLADSAAISQTERDILLISALIHDYEHLGKWRHRVDYWQEVFSCDKAIPVLMRYGMDSRLSALFYDMICCTSPQANLQAPSVKGNDILSLLLDADLYGSLFLSRAIVDQLTAQLKYEDRMVISRKTLQDRFLEACERKGLASAAGAQLHAKLRPSQTYFKGA